MEAPRNAKAGTKPRPAKSVTREEVLAEIIHATHKEWPADIPFHKDLFMLDNPSFHQLTEEQIEWLLAHTPLESKEQLVNPPCNSGDFMQCIEHVHGIICHKWWKARLGKDLSELWEDWEAELQAIFKRAITAEGVTKNCHKVVRLCEHILQEKTGGYAPPNLV